MSGSGSGADGARERGNAFFKSGEYASANEQYDEALALLKDDASAGEAVTKCRLNKAACLLKLQGYAAAGVECRAVLEVEPGNAKAHFRLGQAAERLGDYPTAQRELTDAIKLQPSLKEPRDLLEQIKKRLKENPRLEQALQDMALVEERGLRALNYADIKRARQQLELLLKDARSHKEAHWEARALLALALLCEDEGECEGATDYIDAARRKLTAEGDRRAELYCLQTHALVLLDQGAVLQAQPMLEGGLLLAKEMGEKGLAARFVGNLALVHSLRGDYPRAIEYGSQAVAAGRERNDAHFEAVSRTVLAQALRRADQVEAAREHLNVALNYAEGLGYSHVLTAALREVALLRLEKGRGAERITPALGMLERCHKISSVNGLRRAACDDALNMCTARLKYRVGTRADALAGLTTALKDASSLGYMSCRIELLVALALGHLREPAGGTGWTAAEADLQAAEEHLDAALKLVETGGTAHAQVLTQRSLVHLLRASSDSSATGDDFPEAVKALRCAAEALVIGSGADCFAAAAEAEQAPPPALINVAIAMLTAQRAAPDQLQPEFKSAAAAALALLERAVVRAGADHETRGHALLALAGAHEKLGDMHAAADKLRLVLDLMVAGGRLPADAAERAASGDACRAAGDGGGAVAAYNEALASSSA